MTIPSVDEYVACTRPDWTVTDGEDHVPTLTKRISDDEPYLSGHYPGNPVYPGVFQLDLCFALLRERFSGSVVTEIESIRFVAPVHPGDEIRISATDRASRSAHQVDANTRRIQFVGRNEDDTKLFTVIAKVCPS